MKHTAPVVPPQAVQLAAPRAAAANPAQNGAQPANLLPPGWNMLELALHQAAPAVQVRIVLRCVFFLGVCVMRSLGGSAVAKTA